MLYCCNVHKRVSINQLYLLDEYVLEMCAYMCTEKENYTNLLQYQSNSERSYDLFLT